MNKGKVDYIPPAFFFYLLPFYDLSCKIVGLGKKFRLSIIKELNLKGNERILDAGCGTGELLLFLKLTYPEIQGEGVDPDEGALGIARRKFESLSLNIPLKKGFMHELPYDDEYFDAVITTLAFHHIPSNKKIDSLKECLRVLKKGGIFYLVDFGPPDSRFSSRLIAKVMSWLEHGREGIEGKIPRLMEEAGFKNVKTFARFPHSIVGYKGEK